MNPPKQVISSRVVERKVLGSANPLAKGFRDAKTGCMDSMGGVFLGFILFALAFWPAWCSVKGVAETSKDIEAMELLTAEQAEGQSGMVKVMDEVEDVDFITLEIECRDMDEEIDVFWYKYTLREYQENIETRERKETRVEGGQEVEYTIEEDVPVEEWVVIEEEEDIASSFHLGNIKVDPRHASIRLRDIETCDDKGRERIGEEWLTVEYLPIDDVDELMVVGGISNDEISGGDPFIVTDQSGEQLVAQMAGEERGARTGLTILSIIMFFIAFNLIIGPLLFLLKYVPFVGGGLRFGIGVISLVMAIVWVLILRFIIAFWWLILIILAIVIILLLALRKNKPEAEAVAPEAPPPAAPPPSDVVPPTPPVEPPAPSGQPAAPPAGQLRCPKCGDPHEPGDKFCDKCGHKLSD